MTLVLIPPEAASGLAGLHAAAFAHPWSAADLADALASPGAFAVGWSAPAGLAGFILARVVAGEAEILTLAVDPQVRRQGIGRRLLDAAIEAAVRSGAIAMFLEVDDGNQAAVSLYRSANFAVVGRRRAYYADGGDALVMRRDLNSAGAEDYERP